MWGREYGNPKTPLFVSHASERNQWTLNRLEHHNILQRAICFKYVCRKMIGCSKTLLIISKEEYIKVIKKNAERGFFNLTTPPTTPKVIPDTLNIPKESVTITDNPPEPIRETPILKADSLITLNEFLFEINSYKLRAEHFYELDLLSNYLMAHPSLEVSISGHTDNTGNEKHNVTLSTHRAEAVAEYLVSKRVDYDKVDFRGLGSAKPISGNETVDGRSRNRRVEILIRNARK